MPQETPEELPHRARVVPFRFENVGIINTILLPVRLTIWVGVWVFALIATLAYSYLRGGAGEDHVTHGIGLHSSVSCPIYAAARGNVPQARRTAGLV